MKLPKISIVVPSYNKVKFIAQTLDSIIMQTYPNLEVIIQDGGSTDGTVGIIKKYVTKYPKIIKYESKKDEGQLDAINKGLKRASGKILTYINADDVYENGSLRTITEMFASNSNALWFAGRGKIIDSKGREIAKAATWYKNFFLKLNSYYFLLCFNYLMQPSVFITRKAWKKFGPFAGTSDFVTEYDLWLKIAKYKMPIISGKYFSSFRIEPLTITKTKTNKLLSEDEKIVSKYTDSSIVLLLHKLHNFGRLIIGGKV
jgi:glycosyltransferase involved in cell wall biosynthesis